jgi:peptidoglycan hydrolase-like protein with peptidoglycan-binding domain
VNTATGATPAAGGGLAAQPQPGTFAQLHPRGRGGRWILKPGAGTGAGGPDETTKQLQERLKQLGFNVPQDGKYGPETAAAVASFQTRYGLDPHGGVDAATLALLQEPPPQTLKQVQKTRSLNAKGNPKSTAKHKAKRKAKSTSGAKRSKSKQATKTTQRVKTTAQASPGSATGTVTAPSLGAGALAQGQGMTGGANRNVTSLQTALTQAGYKVAADGRFGPETEVAVKKLQREHGLTPDGVVGPETKGLLIGLDSTRSTGPTPTQKPKPRRKAKPGQKLLPGEVATLRTKQPIPRHGSRTAGSRMRLKPPAKQPTTLKYHAEQEDTAVLKIKRLEETTLAFGVGGVPSMSIKDGRDTTPDYDLPIWTITGVRIRPPDETLQDGRKPSPRTRPGLVIPDGRTRGGSMSTLQEQLAEAVQARKSATSSTDFVRARAREQVLRDRLEMEEAIGPIKKNAFHAWLGKKPDEPITDADIAKGKAAGGHPAKMAHFAEQARKWGKRKKKAKAAA